MLRLMLLRHAKTETDAPSGRAQDRRLDERGLRDAAEMGGWIGRHPPFPDCVFVSPAVRAQQTWDLAWAAVKGLGAPPRWAAGSAGIRRFPTASSCRRLCARSRPGTSPGRR